MKCPNDNSTLVMSDRSGVEIDYCPECRGVWLDRGELDKIIDRASAQTPATAAAPQQPVPPQHYSQPQAPQQYSQPGYDPRGGYPKRKRENWLSELFD